MGKYYFFDRGFLLGHALSGVSIHPAQGRKCELNPMFTEEAAWELRYDNSYPTVIYDPQDGLYKLFYSIIVEDEECRKTPVEQRLGKTYIPRADRIVALAYACSRDGLHWEKPNLGIVDYHGSKENNLLLIKTHGAGVMLDDKETDPAKRYKLIALDDDPEKADRPDGRFAQMSYSFSPDGIHWDRLKPWPEHNPWGDTDNFPLRDPTDGKFRLITRTWHNGMRMAVTCESDDFIHWTEEKPALHGTGYHDQVYSMPVFVREGLYLGLASIYHEGDRSAQDFDCVDLELTYAKDPTEFFYAAKGEPFIPRGNGTYHNGEFDCCCIFAAPPIIEDGKMHFYYMGGNGQHTNFRETSFGRITFDEDKFAYITSNTSGSEGRILTSALRAEADGIWVLADFDENSSLRAALLAGDDYESPEGFSESDCKLVKEPDGWTRLEFARPLSELKGKNFCMRFVIKNVKLYAVKGGFRCVSGRY